MKCTPSYPFTRAHRFIKIFLSRSCFLHHPSSFYTSLILLEITKEINEKYEYQDIWHIYLFFITCRLYFNFILFLDFTRHIEISFDLVTRIHKFPFHQGKSPGNFPFLNASLYKKGFVNEQIRKKIIKKSRRKLSIISEGVDILKYFILYVKSRSSRLRKSSRRAKPKCLRFILDVLCHTYTSMCNVWVYLRGA